MIWICAEFAAYYLLSGTPNGSQFVGAEMQADFARSGASDYWGWVMAEFYGAAFFHPLLSLVLGSILGTIGATVGWLLGRRSRT